ncbi:MAG TPA: DUF2846 domain-containing protein [Pyrinomonadaceae bacterium]|nr:DUF2846 domain-containing protein [Pyrinomonadaceae bacterium]
MFLCIKQSLVVIAVLASLSVPLNDEIVVTDGTPINLITAKEILTREVKPDDPIEFTVAEDLTIDGQVVIRKGTPAIASVIIPEKGGYLGKSGKLAIHIESTTTSNGQPLKLRAAKARAGDETTTSAMLPAVIDPTLLFQYGREPKIAPGRTVTVYVAEEKRFRVEGATLVPVVTETSGSQEATVFIYRSAKALGRLNEPSVFVDKTEVARMDNGRYLALKLKPGKHTIRMTDDEKGYTIDASPGQTYFFRIGIERGMFKGHSTIVPEDRSSAVAEIRKLKFIGQDKIKTPALVVEVAPE